MIEFRTINMEAAEISKPNTGFPGRLLMVTTVASTAYAFLIPYADRMRQAGWKVSLATSELSRRPDLNEHFDEIIEMPWRRDVLSISRNLTALLRMRSLLLKDRFDLVHTHTPIASFLTRIAVVGVPTENRPKIIYTAHGFHFHRNGGAARNGLFRMLEKIAGRWTDYLIVINDEDEKAALEMGIVSAGHLIRAPGIGISVQAYEGAERRRDLRTMVRARIGVPSEDPMIIMIAEFSRDKCHLDLLRAVRLSVGYKWHIVFAGEGKTLSNVKRFAVQCGLIGRCHFLGFCKDIPALLASADISALPSKREGLPRAILESMAASIPIIGADSRGTRDLLNDDCGILHAVGDCEELKKGLERLISSPQLRRCVTTNARRRVEAYKLEPILGIHEKIYRLAMSGKRLEKLIGPGAGAFDSVAEKWEMRPPRVLVIGPALSSLTNIRGPLMREMHSLGCEVLAIASDRSDMLEAKLLSWGIRFQYLPMARTGISPLSDLQYCMGLTRVVKSEKIDMVLAYTHKPVLYGALSLLPLARTSRPAMYGLITGLGYAFTEENRGVLRRRVIEKVLTSNYRLCSGYIDGLIFQNPDDEMEFGKRKLISGRMKKLVVRGSGVDVDEYAYTPVPAGPLKFLFISRLLAAKGVREFATAAREIGKSNAAAEFVVVGPFDQNPSGISEKEIDTWCKDGFVRYEGSTDNAIRYLKESSVFVLPSYYREGIPRTILEAMSIGRAIITTDTPGCRETIFATKDCDSMGVREGSNGFLVPSHSVEALVATMNTLISKPDLIIRMGGESRRLAEQYFDVKLVNREMLSFMKPSSGRAIFPGESKNQPKLVGTGNWRT